MSGMAEFIPVLSSNDMGVALMGAFIREMGTDDPKSWVPVFMRRSLAADTHNLGVRVATP